MIDFSVKNPINPYKYAIKIRQHLHSATERAMHHCLIYLFLSTRYIKFELRDKAFSCL